MERRLSALVALALLARLMCVAAFGQIIPPQAIDQFQQVIGTRVELLTILGGDYGAAGGIYTFRGGEVANYSFTKIGGGGAITAPMPLFDTGVSWAPVILGNVGDSSAVNEFPNGYLQGNKSEYDLLAVQLGGGARFYFTEHWSLAAAVSGIYGHTENKFLPQNAIGQAVNDAASGTYVNWQLDTWTVAPTLDMLYDWSLQRTAFSFRSRYSFFHTDTFRSSSPVVSVRGDSQAWENKLDADVPLGLTVFGRELHTGGFFSDTELYGDAVQGLDSTHFFTVNGRLVVGLLGEVWKTRWIGLGVSYFFGGHFDGWSAGLDLSFEF